MYRFEHCYISSYQVACLLAMTILGDAIFFLHNVSTANAGRDTWLSFLLATITGLGFVWLVVTLGKRFPNQTIIEYSRSITGFWLGSLIGFFYVSYFFITTSYITRDFGEFITTTTMPKTPTIVFMLGLMCLCVYALQGGIEILGRLGQVLCPLYILFIIITISFTSSHLSIIKLAPVLESPPGRIVKGMIPPTAWMAEVAILLVILPFVINKSHVFKWGTIGALLGGGILTIIELWLLGIFGDATVAQMRYPFFSLNREIARLDGFAMVFWIMGDFIRALVFFFVSATSLAQWLHLRDYRPLLIPMSVIIVAFAHLLPNIVKLHFIGGTWYPFYALSIKIGIPLFLLVWSSVAGKEIHNSPT